MVNLIHRLLATCARARCDEYQYPKIAQAAALITDWTMLPAQAQAHGMTPLVHHHLAALNVTLPFSVKREISALVVRSRLASRLHGQCLHDLLCQFQAAGIQVLVLKGAALSHVLYPDPALRPMRDLDLLVHRADLKRAQQLLGALGFIAPMTFASHQCEHRHLSAAIKQVEGFAVEVELHHALFERDAAPISIGLDNLSSPPISFPLAENGVVGWTLGYEDMLWHLCQHLVESTNIFSAVALIWVADIISFAERYAAQMDWARIQRQYPMVLGTLALLHFLTPLSALVIERAGLTLGREPQGLWDDFRKLPRMTPEAQASQGIAQTLRDAATPSEWWLRLHYELGSAQPVRWHHWVRHLAYLVRRRNFVSRRQARVGELPRIVE